MYEPHRQLAERGGEYLSAGAKGAPPVAVSLATVSGVPLDQWVVILTIVYLVAQIGYLGWKWARDIGRARRERRGG